MRNFISDLFVILVYLFSAIQALIYIALFFYLITLIFLNL